MPAISRMIETNDHIAPRSSACCRPAARAASCWCRTGPISPGRSVTADHAAQKKKAVSALRSAARGSGVVGHRVLLAQLVQRRRVAEQVAVVRCDLGDRRGALGGHRDRPARGVVRVAPQLGLQRRVDRRRARRATGRRTRAGTLLRPARRAARPPRGAASRPTNRAPRSCRGPRPFPVAAPRGKPRLLAGLDVVTGVEGRALDGDHRLRDGRGGEIDFAAQPAQRANERTKMMPSHCQRLRVGFTRDSFRSREKTIIHCICTFKIKVQQNASL